MAADQGEVEQVRGEEHAEDDQAEGNVADALERARVVDISDDRLDQQAPRDREGCIGEDEFRAALAEILLIDASTVAAITPITAAGVGPSNDIANTSGMNAPESSLFPIVMLSRSPSTVSTNSSPNRGIGSQSGPG